MLPLGDAEGIFSSDVGTGHRCETIHQPHKTSIYTQVKRINEL